MAKRGNGDGSLYWDKRRKRWIALIWVQGKRKAITTDLPRDAKVAERKKKLAELIAQYANPAPVAATPPTVEAYLERWNKAAQIAESTRYRQDRLIRYLINPHLGGLLLTEVTHQHIAAMVAALGTGTHPYRPRTIQVARTVLGTALRQAVRLGLLDRNPADLVRAPGAPRRDYPLLSGEQFVKLLEACQHVPDGALFILALTTGLRIGELLGLRWTDLDTAAQTLRIERSVNNLGGDAVRVTIPKTASSRRLIVLPAVALVALERHRAQQAGRRLRLGAAWHDMGLVFPNTSGGLGRASSTGRAPLKSLLQKLKLPAMRFHDLRHNAASHLLDAGVPLQVVSELLGHASPAITQAIYGHLLEGQRRTAAIAMDRIAQPVASTVASSGAVEGSD